jgi:hypothetical protein
MVFGTTVWHPIDDFFPAIAQRLDIVLWTNVVWRTCFCVGFDRPYEGDEVTAWFDEGTHLFTPGRTESRWDSYKEAVEEVILRTGQQKVWTYV